MARPSRVSTITPQAAEHSRHVEAKYVETPGTVWSGETRYGMSFPVSSEQAVVANTALEAPRTLRNSRRLTPVFCVSWLISVVAVRAVVSSLLAVAGGGCRGAGTAWRRLRVGISSGLEAFLRAVDVHVTADAPPHVDARELSDAIHFLDLSMTG